jgi:lantibiotic modifying enzyme
VSDRVFRDYVHAYRDAVCRVEYEGLDRIQPAPYATLSHGGAGTAYALWRLGELRRASAWVTAALADRRRNALEMAVATSTRRGSTLFGRAGVRWVHALVAGGDLVGTYAHDIQTHAPRLEFASGAAGHLVGAVLLSRRRPNDQLGKIAAQLAHRLLRAAQRRARRPWHRADATGFAHGWPGVLYALLMWHEHNTAPVPPWFADALRRLATAWSPGLASRRSLEASWCNGSAGAVLLWSKAHACLGDAIFLRVARRAAWTALAASGRLSGLCCGDVGVAFAVLALARIDPDQGWRRQARVLAARSITDATMPWPLALFQGHSGLVCLALDCLGEPVGFPGVEG